MIVLIVLKGMSLKDGQCHEICGDGRNFGEIECDVEIMKMVMGKYFTLIDF